MSSVTITGVQKSFGDVAVLRDIDLTVRDGEFVVFVGPSGCGKSTLLRLICGLDTVTAGTIAFAGEVVNDVPPAKRGVAMVFQNYALYPHMSVAQNMGYALRLAGTDRREIDKRVGEAAAVLRLDKLLDRKPRQLSGGQRQRVAIGRAIVRRPRIFLFDEPLSNLDAALRVEMRAEIAALKARLGTTTIYVTHDQIEAMTLADRIVVMNAGRIEQTGAPLELYQTPRNLFVAGFIGSPRMNLLAARKGDGGKLILSTGGALRLNADVPPSSNLHLGIRPEHCALVTRDTESVPDLAGHVRLVEHLGSDVFVHVSVADAHTLLVRHAGSAIPAIGQPVGVRFDADRLHVFGSDGLRLPDPASVGRAA